MSDLNHLIVIYLTKEKINLVSDRKVDRLLEDQKIGSQVVISTVDHQSNTTLVFLSESSPDLSTLGLSQTEYIHIYDPEKEFIAPICHLGSKNSYKNFYLIKDLGLLKTLNILIELKSRHKVNLIDVRLIGDEVTPNFTFFQTESEVNLKDFSDISKVKEDVQVKFN